MSWWYVEAVRLSIQRVDGITTNNAVRERQLDDELLSCSTCQVAPKEVAPHRVLSPPSVKWRVKLCPFWCK